MEVVTNELVVFSRFKQEKAALFCRVWRSPEIGLETGTLTTYSALKCGLKKEAIRTQLRSDSLTRSTLRHFTHGSMLHFRETWGEPKDPVSNKLVSAKRALSASGLRGWMVFNNAHLFNYAWTKQLNIRRMNRWQPISDGATSCEWGELDVGSK